MIAGRTFLSTLDSLYLHNIFMLDHSQQHCLAPPARHSAFVQAYEGFWLDFQRPHDKVAHPSKVNDPSSEVVVHDIP